jgi:hypothetical protein
MDLVCSEKRWPRHVDLATTVSCLSACLRCMLCIASLVESSIARLALHISKEKSVQNQV